MAVSLFNSRLEWFEIRQRIIRRSGNQAAIKMAEKYTIPDEWKVFSYDATRLIRQTNDKLEKIMAKYNISL